jgi:hypothetical protein
MGERKMTSGHRWSLHDAPARPENIQIGVLRKDDSLPLGGSKWPYFLASGENSAISRSISHGNMAQKAVRWQPGREGSFAHTFPEEPTGEPNHGATRFFYASAA